MFNLAAVAIQAHPAPGVTLVMRLLNSGKCSVSSLLRYTNKEVTIRFLHSRTLDDPAKLEKSLKNSNPGFPLRSQLTYNIGFLEEARVKSALLKTSVWKELINDLTDVTNYRYVYDPRPSKRFSHAGTRIIKKLASNMSVAIYLEGANNRSRITSIEYSSL